MSLDPGSAIIVGNNMERGKNRIKNSGVHNLYFYIITELFCTCYSIITVLNGYSPLCFVYIIIIEDGMARDLITNLEDVTSSGVE